MPPAVRPPDRLLPHPGSRLAFTPGGQLIVSGGWPCFLTAFDPATGDPLAERRMQALSAVLAVAPDGSAVYTGEKTASGFALPGFRNGPPSLKGHRYTMGDLAFSPSGAMILTVGAGHVAPPDDTLRGWDRMGKQLFRIPMPGHGVQVAFLDEGSAFVACVGGHLALWDLAKKQVRWMLPAIDPEQYPGVGPLVLAADRATLYAFHNHLEQTWESGFLLLDPATGEIRGRWATAARFKSGHCFGAAEDPRTRDLLAALGDNGGSDETGHVRVRRLEAGSGAWIASYGHRKQAVGVAISPDGRWLASALQDLNQVAIWDLQSG